MTTPGSDETPEQTPPADDAREHQEDFAEGGYDERQQSGMSDPHDEKPAENDPHSETSGASDED